MDYERKLDMRIVMVALSESGGQSTGLLGEKGEY